MELPAVSEGLLCGRLDTSRHFLNQIATSTIRRADVSIERLQNLRYAHATLLLKPGLHAEIAYCRSGRSKVGITRDPRSGFDAIGRAVGGRTEPQRVRRLFGSRDRT